MTEDGVPSRFAVDLKGATLLGIYRVERKIADGGMGSVWLGEDTNLGRRVVVKVPHIRFLGEPGFRARFTREITELVRLEHPNIVRILAQGTHEEIPFFVLQYLGGGSLESRLASAGEGPGDAETVAPWLTTIADTLDFIHGRGVVHRDVKPENILFDEEGHVFLSDFGVVKALDEDLKVTDVGAGVGSPQYMAPEQGLGQPVDGSADQYGLATTVYQAITGRLPFEGHSALEILLNKKEGSSRDLRDLAPMLPAACAKAVMRGLAADPGARFPSCREFAEAFLTAAGIFERTPPTGIATGAVPRRRPAAAIAVALLLAIALTVGFAAGWFAPETPTRDGDETREHRGAFEVVLLSPGAEPRRVLRYAPTPGFEETMSTSVATDEWKTLGEAEPVKTSPPTVSARIRLTVSKAPIAGDISFTWESLEMTLGLPQGTPPAILQALEDLTNSMKGVSGFARQNARGLNVEFGHDSPPPDAAAAQGLVILLSEFVEQVSIPLPVEAVGIGARWEVTSARDHLEGIRITQTVTYELESLGENEARLGMYIAVAGLNQDFEHPDLPAAASTRLTSVHGDGEGSAVIDLDRLTARSLWMTLESRAEVTLKEAEVENAVVVDRKLRIETKRE
jgi:serine/threonine protein kinase